MLGEMKPVDIEDVLSHEIIGRIGCHADGFTYVVPISYAYDGASIYGHTKEGMKIKMMRKNPKVCFQVDRMPDMANWQSVILWGEYEELTDRTERKIAMQKLVDRILPIISSETTHLSPHWPFPVKDLSEVNGIVFKIRVDKKTGRFESNSDTIFIQAF